MATKLVTWVFALQYSDNFTVWWNEIKKTIHRSKLRTLSTSCWKLHVKYLNFNRNLINRTKLLKTLYIWDLIVAHNITLLGIVLKVVRNKTCLSWTYTTPSKNGNEKQKKKTPKRPLKEVWRGWCVSTFIVDTSNDYC